MNHRIVHLVSSPSTSGVTALIALLALSMRDDGFAPFLVHYGKNVGITSEFKSEKIPVHRVVAPSLRYGRLRTIWIILDLLRIISKIKPHLIHAHSFDADLLAARLADIFKIPVIVSCQSFSYATWAAGHPEQYRRWVKNINFLVPVCAGLSQEMGKIGELSKVGRKVIFNAPKQRYFSPITHAEREAARKRMGIDADEVAISCVATFDPVKGHEVLAEAFGRLNERRPNLKLIIAGNSSAKIQFQDFKKKVIRILNSSSASDRYTICDPCHDARPVLAASDIYVQPSHTEALSVAVGEAQASGLPVVATMVGGNPEIVQNGENGFLVPPNDPVKMADAIEALAADMHLRVKLGSGAKRFADNRLAPQRVVSDYQSVYEDLLINAKAQ